MRRTQFSHLQRMWNQLYLPSEYNIYIHMLHIYIYITYNISYVYDRHFFSHLISCHKWPITWRGPLGPSPSPEVMLSQGYNSEEDDSDGDEADGRLYTAWWPRRRLGTMAFPVGHRSAMGFPMVKCIWCICYHWRLGGYANFRETPNK